VLSLPKKLIGGTWNASIVVPRSGVPLSTGKDATSLELVRSSPAGADLLPEMGRKKGVWDVRTSLQALDSRVVGRLRVAAKVGNT